MKLTSIFTLSSIAASILLTSCGTSNPEYKAWKAQQAAAGATTGSNQYGVPHAGGETGNYTPTDAAPFQPLPGVNPAPTPQPPLASDTSTAPLPESVTSHTIAAGDSLWALARKYNTSVEAIQAANNMTDTIIRTGQTLKIPNN